MSKSYTLSPSYSSISAETVIPSDGYVIINGGYSCHIDGWKVWAETGNRQFVFVRKGMRITFTSDDNGPVTYDYLV